MNVDCLRRSARDNSPAMVCGVGDHRVGQNVASHSEIRYQALASAIPLLALALEAVDIQRHRHAEQARQPGEDRVGGVAVERDIARGEPADAAWRDRCARGCRSICAGGGQVVQAHAAIDGLGMPLAAVDGDAVAALGQPGGKFFGEGFEAAVAGGNAARAEERDAHRTGGS